MRRAGLTWPTGWDAVAVLLPPAAAALLVALWPDYREAPPVRPAPQGPRILYIGTSQALRDPTSIALPHASLESLGPEYHIAEPQPPMLPALPDPPAAARAEADTPLLSPRPGLLSEASGALRPPARPPPRAQPAVPAPSATRAAFTLLAGLDSLSFHPAPWPAGTPPFVGEVLAHVAIDAEGAIVSVEFEPPVPNGAAATLEPLLLRSRFTPPAAPLRGRIRISPPLPAPTPAP